MPMPADSARRVPLGVMHMIYIDEVWTSVVRYTTILKRGSPWAPAEELFQDKVLADAGRPADWAELRPWLGVRGQG